MQKTLLSVVTLLVMAVGAPARWARPTGRSSAGRKAAGVADAAQLPVKWSATQNVAWTVDVPGRGWSSPIVWGNRVFVTSAVSDGGFKQPSTGIYGNDYVAELDEAGAAAGGGQQARHCAGHRTDG